MEPLSQERLSEKELRHIERHVANRMKQSEFVAMKVADAEMLIAEVKRLQAIEQQNEELRKVIDRQHIQLEKYETIFNGGIDHE